MHLFLEVALSPGVSPAIQDCVLLPGMQRHSQLGSPTFLFTSRAPHPSWVPCMILSHALNLWCCSLRRNALPDLTCSSRQGRIPPGSSLPGRDHLRCVHRALATRHLTAVTSYTRQDPSPHHSGPSITQDPPFVPGDSVLRIAVKRNIDATQQNARPENFWGQQAAFS